MVGDHLAAAIRRHLRIPALLRFREALVKIRIALSEVCSIGGTHFRQLGLIGFGDAASIFRIEPVVRISKRMNVAHGARDLSGRDFQYLAELGHVEMARIARLDLRIAALRNQRWKPSDLELQANQNQKIGFLKLYEKARFRFDKMWILVAFGDSLDSNSIAADVGADSC